MIEILEEKKQDRGMEEYIRQIGGLEPNRRICLEESVYAYLKNQEKSFFDSTEIFILYGRKKIREYLPEWQVSGVIEVSNEKDKLYLTEADWFKINRQASQIYPGEAVLGWGMIGEEALDETEQIEKCFRQYFRTDQNLFFYGNCLTETEDFYLYENGLLTIQKGFFICKDEHNNMGRYVYEKTRRSEPSKVEKEIFEEEIGNDRATRRFRETLQERKEELHHKRMQSFLYTACSILVGVVAIIGITMLQNYEKMETMEVALQTMSGQLDQTVKINEELVDSLEKENEARIKKEQYEKQEQIAQEKRIAMPEQEPQETISENNEIQDNIDKQIIPTNKNDSLHEENSCITYEIKRGDTLAKICMNRYGNTNKIQEICQMNHITDQNTILYGEKILLP